MRSTFLGILVETIPRGGKGVAAGGLSEVEVELGDSCAHAEVEDEDEAEAELPLASVGELEDPH